MGKPERSRRRHLAVLGYGRFVVGHALVSTAANGAVMLVPSTCSSYRSDACAITMTMRPRTQHGVLSRREALAGAGLARAAHRERNRAEQDPKNDVPAQGPIPPSLRRPQSDGCFGSIEDRAPASRAARCAA